MREILFRGKRIDNGEWVEGYYTNACVFKAGCVIETHEDDYQVEFDTVGQYTGLQDKHSTKIFDGDIILAPWWQGQKIETMKGLIEFSKGAFSVVWQDTIYGKHFAGYVADMEVIGNIFDNPELWEENNG